jgi:transcriptional regulator with XRE-family HTH domain
MAEPRSEVTRNLGLRVRELRLEHDLTQERLAERADLSWSYVSQVERGLHNLGIENVLKLAHGLGVLPGDLVNDLALQD